MAEKADGSVMPRGGWEGGAEVRDKHSVSTQRSTELIHEDNIFDIKMTDIHFIF